MDMDIELIVEIVMLFGVYIVVGMIISYIVNDISYLAYDYFWLVTILYPIILTIVFIVLKLINVITWSWWLVLLPGIIEIVLIIITIIAGILECKK